MASDLPALWLAVYNRLTGDTGSGGLFNSGNELVEAVYNTRPPIMPETPTPFPYIVYSVFESSPEESAFRTRVWRRRVRFDVYVEMEANNTIDPLARGGLILRRLEGNWDEKAAGVAPDYGIDRFQPTLTGSGWTADIFDAVDGGEDHNPDDRYYCWFMTFDIRCSKVGA